MKPNIYSEEYKSAITVEQMRRSDRYTIENLVPSRELMYRAACGIYSAVTWRGRIAIVCGSGNNGGDGYALAWILAQNGIEPHIYRVGERFSADGEHYFQKAMAAGVRDFSYSGQDLSGYDMIADCILGTGFHGVPEGITAQAINMINASGAYVVSADINSGINGDTGQAVLAVRSDLTVSIGYYKKGMFLKDAPLLIGELVNADIGIVLV